MRASSSHARPLVGDPVVVVPPSGAPVPVVVDSPHSGMEWPADFVPAAPVEAILTTWDAWIDELWGSAPAHGATLIHARFPRAYVDANRSESDIDESLLSSPWPAPVTPSDYSRRGMGLIRREALPGVPMYDRALRVAEVEQRLAHYYRPYRAAVARALDAQHAAHGVVWHLDCHSMKSRGNAMNVDAGDRRPDIVVSDRRGTAADPAHTVWVADWFRARGLRVQVNTPYEGGDLVRSFGEPGRGRHSIQVELNRALYMDEARIERSSGFAALRGTLDELLRDLTVHAAG